AAAKRANARTRGSPARLPSPRLVALRPRTPIATAIALRGNETRSGLRGVHALAHAGGQRRDQLPPAKRPGYKVKSLAIGPRRRDHIRCHGHPCPPRADPDETPQRGSATRLATLARTAAAMKAWEIPEAACGPARMP